MKAIDPHHIGNIQAFVNSGSMNAALDTMKENYIGDMMATTPDQKDIREYIYSKVQALEEIRATLKNYGSKQAERAEQWR